MDTELETIGKLLSGGAARPGSILDIVHKVEGGLPVAALDRVVGKVAPDDGGFAVTIVPKATLTRRRAASRLNVDESNKVARLAKVWAMALRVWGDERDAQEFLRRPHPMLEGRAPREVTVSSEPGADAVMNLIGRGAYGGGV
jgi:putative toxin-antitoxin system antitoxin component (TIGR02293 family)